MSGTEHGNLWSPNSISTILNQVKSISQPIYQLVLALHSAHFYTLLSAYILS